MMTARSAFAKDHESLAPRRESSLSGFSLPLRSGRWLARLTHREAAHSGCDPKALGKVGSEKRDVEQVRDLSLPTEGLIEAVGLPASRWAEHQWRPETLIS